MNRDEICKLAETMCEVLYQKKAEDILSIDIGEKSVVADYFIVCSGRNNIMVKALSDELEEKMAERSVFPRRKEGYNEGRWVVLDFGDILVHIFHPEERVYYKLERLWDEGQNVVNYSQKRYAEVEGQN